MQYEKSAIQKKCNVEIMQYEQSATRKKCNIKKVQNAKK